MRVIGVLLIVLIAVGAIGLGASAFMVRETEYALVLRFGKLQEGVREPGLNFRVPFMDTVVYLDKRILVLDINPEEVIASDQKRLVVDAFARYRITDPKLFYTTQKNELRARSTLNTILISKLRDVLGEEAFGTLLSGERSALMLRIRDQMNTEVGRYGIETVDVRIKRADLPEKNSQATFERMRSERVREANEARAEGEEEARRIRSRADRDVRVLIAEARKDSEILRGEGDAERTRIFAEAFGQDPEFFSFYRSMRAYENALTGDGTTFLLSPDSDFFRYFGDSQGRK